MPLTEKELIARELAELRDLLRLLFSEKHFDPEFRAEGGFYECYMTPTTVRRVLRVIDQPITV